MGIHKKVPSDIEIAPVYLKTKIIGPRIQFGIAICEFSDPRKSAATLDNLKVMNSKSFNLIFF